ncbi:MAG TPA: DUF177 domain-containing protein [Thermoleophilaceae bacterium]|nr:DUF177 domain-containing protein [Thermoleophilaceae bacterium]
MAQRTDIFDLGRLSLHSGEGRRIDTHVTVDPLSFGGQTYEIEGREVPVRLDISRTMNGYALRLRFTVRLDGPCMRCLEPAERSIEVDAREVDQPGSADDDELSSPYVDRQDLDLRAWSRDALALALPSQIVCTEKCQGLCPICGENLNTAPNHAHASEPDPRWAKLSELKFE